MIARPKNYHLANVYLFGWLLVAYFSEARKNSHAKPITNGVPQGSGLVPLFFLVYINDLPLHLNKDTQNDLFADDAALHTADANLDTI